MSDVLQYAIYRTTQFNEYTAIVVANHITQRTTVYLYVGEPSTRVFGFRLENDPVRVSHAGVTTDINRTVERMIIDYELPLYQRQQAENGEVFLEIDYDTELRKRRQGEESVGITPETEMTQDFNHIPITSWDKSLEETPEERRERLIQETAQRTGKDPNSLRNLYQFREKKAQ